jgi:hypothetical protein
VPYFAKIDIGPGQIVLVERPLVTVPDDKFPEVSSGPSLSSSYGPMGQSMWSWHVLASHAKESLHV